MMTYVDKLEAWLKEIEVRLCEFISNVRIKEFRNDPYSGVVIIIPPYSYDTNLSEEQKKMQMNIKKTYSEWEEHFYLLTTKVPSDIRKEIKESTKYIKNQIELISGWLTRSTISENIDEIKKRFSGLYGIIKLFEGKESIVLIPDTNSLIKSPDFEVYKKLLGDKITILLTPTVLSELDKLKIIHRDETFRKKVESVINRIKGFRKQGSLLNGVTSCKTITIKMVAKEPAFERTLSWLQKDNNDDRIIASSIEYQIDNPSHKVFIVTSDINLQNKAEMAKLPFFETPQKKQQRKEQLARLRPG
jgi:rRNA-processing protein FCF1